MSLKSDDNQDALKPIDLVFILAIAGRIDAQSRILAQQLDKSGYVYYGYAVLDSLSSSYSMFKYFFDLCVSSNDPNLMHDVMMTPGGIIAIAAESLFLVAFSVLAVKFDSEKEDSYKKFIATAWPYFRDVMKGLKNAYKGWRSTVVAINLIGGVDAKFLVAPIGLVLGIFAAANRFWLRGMVENRKVMMTANTRLRNEIKKLLSLTPEDKKYFLNEIKYQSDKIRTLSYVSVALGGFIDGLYLYVGVLGLVALSFPMFSALAVICAVYTVACVITRVYEEYDFQMRLFITQTKCKFELIAKDLEFTHATLLSLQKKINKNDADYLELTRLKNQIYSVLEDFDAHRKLLSQQSTYTYTTAALLGLKNGLYAYGALASILFLVAAILTLSGVAFPPAIIIIGVLSGLVFMAGFIIHSLVVNYQHLNKEQTSVERPYTHLIDMKNKIKTNLEIDELLEAESFRKSMNDGLSVDSSPQFFFQEWFEVIRSLFSGLGKGQKFVDFAGNSMQEPDDLGHYHDTKIMYVFGLVSAAFFGMTLALRALARGFGRAPLGQDQVPKPEAPKPVELKNKKPDTTTQGGEIKDINVNFPAAFSHQPESPKITYPGASQDSKVPGEPSLTTNARKDVPPRSKSYLSMFSFFEPDKTKHLNRSESGPSLASRDPTTSDNTIQGLV